MSYTSDLRPATPEEIANALSFALRSSVLTEKQADESVAEIAAERLIEHLMAFGFVVMKQAHLPASSTCGPVPTTE